MKIRKDVVTKLSFLLIIVQIHVEITLTVVLTIMNNVVVFYGQKIYAAVAEVHVKMLELVCSHSKNNVLVVQNLQKLPDVVTNGSNAEEKVGKVLIVV